MNKITTVGVDLIWRSCWPTRRAVELAIFEYSNGFYNPRRRHSAFDLEKPLGLRGSGGINENLGRYQNVTLPAPA